MCLASSSAACWGGMLSFVLVLVFGCIVWGGLLRRLICLRLHSRLLRLQAGVRAQLSDQLRPLTGGRHARLLRLLRRGLLLLWLIRRLQASGAQMIIIMVVPR